MNHPDAPAPSLPALRVWIVVQTNDGVCLLQESTDAQLARETYDKIRAAQPSAWLESAIPASTPEVADRP